MNYWSLNKEAIQHSSVIQSYLQIINKYQPQLNDKSIDDIIKVRVVSSEEPGVSTTNEANSQKILFDVRILKNHGLPQKMLDELNSLAMPPIVVDAF